MGDDELSPVRGVTYEPSASAGEPRKAQSVRNLLLRIDRIDTSAASIDETIELSTKSKELPLPPLHEQMPTISTVSPDRQYDASSQFIDSISHTRHPLRFESSHGL